MWPKDRLEELDKLLGTSSNLIDNLQKIIQISDELNKDEYGIPRCSFMAFLNREGFHV